MLWNVNVGDLDGYTSTGTPMPVSRDPTNGWGVTIPPGAGTYFFPLGGTSGAIAETVFNALIAQWTATLAGVLTIEATNLPRTLSRTVQDVGGGDVNDWDVSTAWNLIDITQAGSVYAVAQGTGNSMAKYTLTLGGTAAGGAAWNFPELGFLRLRAKLAATAGGFLRLSMNAKLGE